MIEYSKFPIALECLEAAIEEREIHKRYFAAMNLAGVAEELLGKIINSKGKKNQLTSTVETLNFIQNKVAGELGWPTRSGKELKKIMNTPKNSIKHMNGNTDENAKLYFSVEDESKWLIEAAIRNLDILGHYHSDVVKMFESKNKTK
jgi:hypothetical protein